MYLNGLARRSRGCTGLKEHRAARPGLEDEACVASECDFAAPLDPALVDRDSCAVVAEASGNVALPGSGSDDEANDAEAIGGESVFTEGVVAMVVIEGTRGQGEKDEGNDEFVLRLGFYLTFGVHGKLLACIGVSSGEGRLDVLSCARGQDELAEVEVKGPGATEHTGWFGLRDGSNHGGAFGHCDGVVRVIDGFCDRGPDLLAAFRGSRAQLLGKVSLDDPGLCGVVAWRVGLDRL